MFRLAEGVRIGEEDYLFEKKKVFGMYALSVM
jgi:hypothetical protein